MTARLEKAIQQLPPEKIEQLTEYAERLAREALPASGGPYQLSWVGKAANLYPEHKSGVDAAHAAGQMIVESIERSLSK